MKDMASRLTMRVRVTSDGHRAYAEAVEGVFGMDVDFAVLIRLYGVPSEKYDTRYSPSGLIGTMSMSMRRFTRLTNGFSKKFENHCHSVALHYAYYNFCRVHQSLRVTPAMEAKLTDNTWSIGELLSRLDSNRPTTPPG